MKRQKENKLMASERLGHCRISDWAIEDRPREKLLRQGPNSLSNAELLAILLRTGNQRETALDLARKLLSYTHNNLNELNKLSVQTLCHDFEGNGPTKAVTLIAALEIGKRRHAEEAVEKKQIKNSQDIYQLFQAKLADLSHEECWVLLMNNQHRLIDLILISQGGVSETTVDPKIVLKHALDKLATSIVLCHNHPSGNPLPSHWDDKMTQKLTQACSYLDIQLTDHIIIGDQTYYSYADEGKI
jgi:DNA repair protein RadC